MPFNAIFLPLLQVYEVSIQTIPYSFPSMLLNFSVTVKRQFLHSRMSQTKGGVEVKLNGFEKSTLDENEQV
jgi:hypothetical protein